MIKTIYRVKIVKGLITGAMWDFHNADSEEKVLEQVSELLGNEECLFEITKLYENIV